MPRITHSINGHSFQQRGVLSCALLLLLAAAANAASSKLFIVYMGEKKHVDFNLVTASHHDLLTSVFESKDEAIKSIVYSYKHGFSGFAAMHTEYQAAVIAKSPQVVSVKLNIYQKLHTTRSWDFLGLDNKAPPEEPAGLLQKAKYGEDVIVGVIDSGIWPESRSFDDNGYNPVPARWKGICETGQAFNATSCNRKIIGARWYSGGISAKELNRDYKSPRDHVGHGTHVASTIAGSEVRGASYRGVLATGTARGGAPRARLSIYKVCWQEGGCPYAAIIAAIDDAIHDGVDVLSFSLGGGQEITETVHAITKGISVVFSGGNEGPVPYTVGNAMPWVTTVAASTIDRSFPTLISLGNKENLVGQSLYSNATLNSNNFDGLVHAGICDAAALAENNITGKIILCYSRADAATFPPRLVLPSAIKNSLEAGAKGLIFAQYTVNLLEFLLECEGFMACVAVDFEIAARIEAYIGTTGSPVVKVSPAVSVVGDGVLAPRVASFSSRGPSTTFPDILKPDIAAPGVSILAAERDSYVFKSGTSMACPHVSAVVALLKSVHPNWSPSMIKSAIMTTASVADRFGMTIQAEGVPRKLSDPFDFGSGHIDPNKVTNPGLVYDVEPMEYTKFLNCSLGLIEGCESSDLNLNLPSIIVPNLKDHITVRRTVTNVGAVGATYCAVFEAPAGVAMSVEPSIINFTQGHSTSVTFTVIFKARQRVQGGYTFGSLTWSNGNIHSVRIPVAVRTVIQDFVADTS